MPDALVDGVRDSSRRMFGYWLAPDQNNAWVEVHLDATSDTDKPAAARSAKSTGGNHAGVAADKLLVWNCNNHQWKDRGMLSCNVELRLAGEVVWSQSGIPLDWSPDEETATSIGLPKIKFDAVRLETGSFFMLGSGLCEIEVLRGTTNLARGKPAIASGTHRDAPPPTALTDGVKDSSAKMSGYWLGPDQQRAWVEVQVATPMALRDIQGDQSPAATTARMPGNADVTADKLVLWNCKNHRWSNAGTLSCNVELRKAGKVVWSKKDVPLKWSADDEPSTTIPLPKVAFEALRVEAVTIHDSGTALCEIEIFHGRDNIALGKPTKVSASFDSRFPATAVVDGIKDSSREGVGYWLGPDRSLEWVEVQVAPSSAGLSKTVYLSELPVTETRIIAGSSLSDRQLVSGVRCDHGLLAHPDHNSSSHVAFQLDKKYRTLSGAAALLDRVQRSATPLTFRIVGDGKELWRATIQESGTNHPLNFPVASVSKLELFVDCPGSADQAHAVWVDLELTRAAATAESKANKAP
jgi:hypothetical protein